MRTLTSAWPTARLVLIAVCVLSAALAVVQNLQGTALLGAALGLGALGAVLMLWPALRRTGGAGALWAMTAGAAFTAGAATVHPELTALSASGPASWVACISAGVLVVVSVLLWADQTENRRPTRNF